LTNATVHQWALVTIMNTTLPVCDTRLVGEYGILITTRNNTKQIVVGLGFPETGLIKGLGRSACTAYLHRDGWSWCLTLMNRVSINGFRFARIWYAGYPLSSLCQGPCGALVDE